MLKQKLMCFRKRQERIFRTMIETNILSALSKNTSDNGQKGKSSMGFPYDEKIFMKFKSGLIFHCHHNHSKR